MSRVLLPITITLLLLGCAAQAEVPAAPAPTSFGDNTAACKAFAQLADDVWQGSVTLDHQRDASGQISTIDVPSQMWDIAVSIEDDDMMKRAADDLSLAVYRGVNFKDSVFTDGILAARQLNRLCQHRGYETPSVSPDVIMEYACLSYLQDRC